MTGLLGCARCRGRLSPEPVELAGLPLLSATLFLPPGLSERRLARRLRALEAALLSAGMDRAVLLPDFPCRDRLEQVRPVDPLALCRGLADVLVLGWLAAHGIVPEHSRVVLAGPSLCGELRACAQRLCPRVRALGIEVPGAGESFSRGLRAQFGLPELPPGAAADLRVAFGPCPGPAQLRLYGEPALDGLRLTLPNLPLPPALEPQLLTLLWEQGRATRENLAVLRA